MSSYSCLSVSVLCSVPELCLFLRDLPTYLQYSFRMVSFSLARISHSYERKLRDWSVIPKAYGILNYLYKMHTIYGSASIRNTFVSNICFIHQICSCPMTSNWCQLQLVVNQSDTAQKSLQSYFSCNCFPVTPFCSYHSSSTTAYSVCSILQCNCDFLTSLTVFVIQ